MKILGAFFWYLQVCFAKDTLFGQVYGNTNNIGTKIVNILRTRDIKRTLVTPLLHATTDHNFKTFIVRHDERTVAFPLKNRRYLGDLNVESRKKQFARSKLARGSALSKKCNSRCAIKTPCNKRCQLARDRYQLELAKKTYKKNNVKQYTTSQINQRSYSGQVAKGACNSRCQAAKARYQKQRTQYMKTFHVPCQNGHLKNTGTYHGKPLSDQGNPSGDTPGDKTTIGGYGGVAKGRPLGAPGAGQINWPNSAKYNWRTDCKSYASILGPTKPPIHLFQFHLFNKVSKEFKY